MQRWIADRYGDEDQFDFYAVNINENRNLVANYVEAIGLETPVIMAGNAVWNNYRLRGGISPWPVDYIIDGDGIIQYANHEYEPEIIVMTIDRLLDIQDQIPRIITSADTLDFGETEIGQSTVIPVRVWNDGNADLIISGCEVEGDFFEVKFEDELTIAPGDSGEIELSFFPEDSTAIGERTGIAISSCNDPDQSEIPVFLEGTGIEVNSTGQGVSRIMPAEFFLLPAYPNPFNSTTTFKYGLPVSSDVKIWIYDISGKLVTTVFSGKQKAGFQSMTWEASNISTGVYLVKLQTGGFNKQQKIVLTR